jgi:hypothetical protein
VPLVPVENYERKLVRRDLDLKELNAAQLAQLKEMEAAPDGDAAYEKGAGLPPSVRLYLAAAQDFRQQKMEKAVARFKAVLDLPDAKFRDVLAAFMLGRIALKQAEAGDPAQADTAMADKYFELTRSLVAQGRDDTLGLASASYGEQARVHLIAAGFLRSSAEPVNGAEVIQSCRFYTKQAETGAISGLWSLQEVSRWLFDDKSRLAAVIDDAFMQNLLVAYAAANESPVQDMADTASRTARRDKLAMLLEVAHDKGLKKLARSDGLALLAYKAGRYEEAAAFAAKSSTSLASWVTAKLALQKGDLAKAGEAYHQALEKAPDLSSTSDMSSTGQLYDESGLLNVARGDFLSALKLLYRTSWLDAAHLAERILTTKELTGFVDQYAPESIASGDADVSVQERARNIRWLLARRLMREGDFSAAMPYFPDQPLPEQDAALPTVRQYAKNYVEALKLAEDAKAPRLEQARAWFAAATLARSHGIDILGYETFPDYHSTVGNFDLGDAFSTEKFKDKQYVSEDESRRFDATRPAISARFHYRYLAAQQAEKAAALLAPRSQAYAAVLCAANGWMQGAGATAQAQDLYRQYVKNGSRFDWAVHFGHNCPAPDFTR